MDGVMVTGIRRGRCEFPNCSCMCMENEHNSGICSQCHHVDAWHANLDRDVASDYAAGLGFGRAESGLPVAAPAPAAPAAPVPPLRAPRGRGTARAEASGTEALIANILSQEMKTDRTLCCICLENHCNTVVKPCGHARFCNACILSLPSPKKCPLCRERVLRKTNFVPI